MKKTLVALTCLFSAAAFAADAKKDEKKKEPEQKVEQMKLTNIVPFDVAVCHPAPEKLLSGANEANLVGALIAARPAVMECLVDPKNRGPADATKVTIDTVVDETGAKHAVAGDNLSPDGKACVEKALGKWVNIPKPSKGAKEAKAHVEFEHKLSTTPAVKLGVNEPSDLLGKIRLAEPNWCECFAEYKDKVPPELSGSLAMKKGGAPEITADPGTDAKLFGCVSGKLKALGLSTQNEQLKVPLRFYSLNSLAETTPETPDRPDLQFSQLDLQRARRNADVAVELGRRQLAAEAYDAIVTKYQKTKDFHLLGEMKTKCAALVDASTGWRDALKHELDVEDATVTFAQNAQQKDPAWKEAADAAVKQRDQAKKDLDTASGLIERDKAACPKVK